MKLYKYFYFIFLLFFSSSLEAHTFTGMIGFYDGLSHPVLGIDHFLAMVSVGIISAQIGGRSIWTIPATFVGIMVVGGILGIAVEINKGFEDQTVDLKDIESINYLADNIFVFIEYGIIFSVIFLGLTIAIDKKLSSRLIMFFVAIFGFCHGTAHGLEMPWAANPALFALGFAAGTSTLHLFGVGIGYYAIKTTISSLMLRIIGICFALYGSYLIFSF